MASDDYAAVFVKWLGATLTEEELTSPPSAVLAAWDADLEALLAGTERYGGYRTAISSDQTRRDDPETPWNELIIFLWVNFYPGEIVATCDEGAAPPLGICIMRDLEEPWTALEAKRDALETVKLQAQRAIERSESAIGRAERGHHRRPAEDGEDSGEARRAGSGGLTQPHRRRGPCPGERRNRPGRADIPG